MNNILEKVILATVCTAVFSGAMIIGNVTVKDRAPVTQALEDTTTTVVTTELVTNKDIDTDIENEHTTKKNTTTSVLTTIQDTTACTSNIYQTLKLGYKKYAGEFSLTFYTPREDGGKWGYQTSTGATSVHLKTCAVDPNVIPLGSTIEITGDNGQKLVLVAVDIGGGIKGNRIDIFWDHSTSEGYDWMSDFGTVQSVYIIKE